jgi:hypothetical protein
VVASSVSSREEVFDFFAVLAFGDDFAAGRRARLGFSSSAGEAAGGAWGWLGVSGSISFSVT